MSVAMVPPAPARLSTTSCWPQISLSLAATIRAVTSTPPPGAKPTSNRPGLFGYGCEFTAPAATRDSTAPKVTASHFVLFIFIFPLRQNQASKSATAQQFAAIVHPPSLTIRAHMLLEQGGIKQP